MNNLKWLHLSDIHYCYKSYDTDWLRDSLISKLEDIKNIDFLFITGDLLYQCKNNFSEVKSFIENIIEKTNIDKNKVLIVPGNHDFPRNSIRSTIINGLYNNDNKISYNVSEMDDKLYDFLLKDHKIFFDFYKDFLDKNIKWNELHCLTEFSECNVVSLNTCLISGQDNEEGKLSINLNKLIKVLKKIKKSPKPNIVIGHHSVECFDDSEKEQIIQLFDDYDVDLYLCGHVHKTKFKTHNESKRDIQSLVCGSGMVDDYAEPSFIIGEIDLNLFSCNVKYYIWNKTLNRWNEDLNVSRKIIDNSGLNFYLSRLCEIKKKEIIDSQDLIERINELTSTNVTESKFQKFLLDFCRNISTSDYSCDFSKEKDVEEKFSKMKCTKSFQSEFDTNVEYFNVIDNIFSDSSYLAYDRKTLIPGVLRSVYKKSLYKCNDGDKIMDNMIDLLCDEYEKGTNIPRLELEQYFRTIIYWSINKCTIYNDIK